MIQLGLQNIYFFILPTFFVVIGLRLLLGRRTLPQRVLGVYFLAFFLRNVSAYQLLVANTSFYIHFHYIQSPLHYLFGPLGFLFCLYALKPYRNFKWYDLVHFLPFILHVIELLPFFFGPVDQKFKDLQLSIMSGSYINYPSLAGTIPVVYHAIFKILLSIVYVALQIRVWYRYVKKQESIFYKNNNLLLKWIGLGILFKVVSLILILLQFLGVFNVHNIETFSSSDLLMFLGGVMNFIFYIFSPKLLNGAIFDSLSPSYFDTKKSNDIGQNVLDFHDERTAFKVRELKIFMEVEAPFLQEDFSIKFLAKHFKTTERALSKLIKDHFEMSFPDFVGSYRLNYLKKILKESEGEHNFTIESLAERAGFGSRQALYKVVHRIHQTSPNKFFDVN